MVLTLLAACSQDSTYDTDDNPTPGTAGGGTRAQIAFRPTEIGSDNKGADTRAAQTTTATITTYGVSSSVYDAAVSYTSAGCGSYFFNEQITAASGMCKYYWPGAAYRISFFAYAPYGNNMLTISSAKTKLGRPTYSYTVPSDVTNQLDIITAEVLDMSGTATTTPVSLTFHHKLADIRFSVYNQHPTEDLTVNSITVYGLKYNGTLEGDTWSLSGSISTASTGYNYFTTNTEVTAGATVDITGSNGHLMVLPQNVAPTFVVKTTENGSERTYTKTLDRAFDLKMGTVYTFKLTLGDGLMTVVADDINDWEVEQTYIQGSVTINDWEDGDNI